MSVDSTADLIHEWLHQPIPEKLWHYTSVRGFKGIIESASIYATDVRFLNDAEEFIHARKVAKDLVAQEAELGEFKFPIRESLGWTVSQIFKSKFLNPNSAQIFVASFTDLDDDLSQWRAYSHGTFGVSIGFDLRWVRPPIEFGSAVSFAPCVYKIEEKERLIKHALRKFLAVSEAKWGEAMNEFLENQRRGGQKPNPDQINEFTNRYFSTDAYKSACLAGFREAQKGICRIAGLLKHRAFHHEREWRLVLPISPGKDKTQLIHPIRFRPTSASLIPYIEFPLDPHSHAPTRTPLLPINDVMLGPGGSSEALNAAHEFLKSHGVSITPRRSDVPYKQI